MNEEITCKSDPSGKYLKFSGGIMWPHPEAVLEIEHRMLFFPVEELDEQDRRLLTSICYSYLYLIGSSQMERNEKAIAIKKAWTGLV